MTKVFLQIIFLLSFSFSFLHAQPTKEKFEEIDAYIATIFPEWHIPGCCYAIVYKDSIVYTKAFGFRDIQKKLPVTPSTVFRIGSLTKSFTALSCTILQENKQLDLDQPIIKYLSDFKLYNDELTNNVTVRDLLNHRTGLPRYDKLTDYNHFTKDELYHKLEYLEPTQSFRSTFQYNNLMYVLAGYILERRSGSTWKQFIDKNITVPLSMTNTDFDLRHYEARADHAIGYEYEDSLEVKDDSGERKDESNAAGSMSSNIIDLAHYAIALEHSGRYNGKNIISRDAITNCFTPYIFTGGFKYPEIFYEAYGLGWFLNSYKGHIRINHEGNVDGFSASMCLMPDDSFAIIILTNLHQTGFTYVARNFIIDKMLGVAVTDWNSRLHANVARNQGNEAESDSIVQSSSKETIPPNDLKKYVGVYINPAFGKITVFEQHNKLYYNFNGRELGFLSYFHKDCFIADLSYDDNMRLNFIPDPAGKIMKLTLPLEESLGHDIEFNRH